MRKGVVFLGLIIGMALSGCVYIPLMPGPIIEESESETAEVVEETPKHSADDPIEGCYARVANADLVEFMVQVDDMVFAPGVTTMNHVLDKIDEDGRYTYSVLLDDTNRIIQAITIYKNEALYVVVHNAETENGNVVGVINPSKEARANCWISGGYCLDGSNSGEPGNLPLDSFDIKDGAGAGIILLPTYSGAICTDLSYKFLTPAK